MEFDENPIGNTLEHRGCGIRAASYEVAPTHWLPEACVWFQMETGARKFWVHSFAHCFAAEQLTFSHKLDADNWALEAAKSIIDRAHEKLESSSQVPPPPQANYFSRAFGLTPGAVFGRLRAKPHR